MHMCFVRGLYFGSLANCSALLLSTNTVEKVFIAFQLILINEFRKSIICLIGMKSCVLCDKGIYSASIIDKATSVCILDT